MHRFFIPKEWIAEEKVLLKGERAHQICHVLRLKPQDHIIVLDNSGWEYELEIEKLSGELAQGRIVRKDLNTSEPAIRITLLQALLKADKFEFVLQKGVELGVSSFVPFISDRCVVRKPGENKSQRWQKIIREAAEQSSRGLLPTIHPVVSFVEACQLTNKPAILLWEGEKSRGLRTILRKQPFYDARVISLFIGPEGGFPPEEVRFAESRGIITAGLGRRILRADTAGIAAVSAILYEKGELG